MLHKLILFIMAILAADDVSNFLLKINFIHCHPIYYWFLLSAICLFFGNCLANIDDILKKRKLILNLYKDIPL